MKKLSLLVIAIAISLIGAHVFAPSSAQAVTGSDFRPGRIIDDAVFTNKNSMSVAQIQQFLESKVFGGSCDVNGSRASTRWNTAANRYYTHAEWGALNGNPAPFVCLTNYRENPTTKQTNIGNPTLDIPGSQSAAEIIYNAGQQYGINPQSLIVLLQKEQGLVTDDWPWRIQFSSATGAYCPDTAPCDASQAGFGTQVREAARLFRSYMNDPWLYFVGTNNIRYNPVLSCGSSQVMVENLATVALYHYTPYQPNQAALNNLYGTGDACSAYGNRNFWRLHNDWFGSTRQGEYSIVASTNSSDPQQYALLNSVLYPIPDPETKQAWGLSDSVALFEPAYLSSLTRGPAFSRLVRPYGSLDVWLVDAGKVYRFISPEMIQAWNFSITSITDLPPEFTNPLQNLGNLSYNVIPPASSTIYLVDGPALRPVQEPSTLIVWEGESPKNISISQALFASYTVGSPLSGYAIKNSTTHYFVNAGTKAEVSTAQLSLYNIIPSSVPTVSNQTLARLPNTSFGAHIRASTSPAVYLVDEGRKRLVQTPELLVSWSKNATPAVTVVTSGHLAHILDGGAISKHTATANGTDVFIIDGEKLPITTLLKTDVEPSTPLTVSQNLLDTFTTTSATGRFYKSKNPANPNIYVISGGSRFHINDPRIFLAWGGGSVPATAVSDAVLSSFPLAGYIGNYVSNGGKRYLVDSGRLVELSAIAQQNISQSPVVISDTLKNNLGVDPLVLTDAINGINGDYLLSGSIVYDSPSASLSSIWKLESGPVISDATLALFPKKQLSRFVRSAASSDTRIFIKDTNTLYALASPAQVYNLGYDGKDMTTLSAENIATYTITAWTTPLAKDSLGQFFVFDTGQKRTFADITTRDQWTASLPTQPTLSVALLQTFSQTTVINKSIKGSGQQVFAVLAGTKRHVTNPTLYAAQYAPFSTVSETLLLSIPSGPTL